MLKRYENAIKPLSLIEAVPKEVLRSQMQGFFYGLRAGVVLMYDEGADADGQLVLKRLEPVDDVQPSATKTDQWRGLSANYNPFCAKFREKPERNVMCEDCDAVAARYEFQGRDSGIRYRCHMGLVDMTMPIKIDGKVRGVLFGGQKIIQGDDQQHDRILKQVVEKAPELKEELASLILTSAQPDDDVNAFEQSFRKFAEAMQATVSAFTTSHREEVERETLIDLNQRLARAAVGPDQDWHEAAKQLLSDLGQFLEGASLWLLKRRGSRYQCVASTQMTLAHPYPNLSVAALIGLPKDSVQPIVPNTGIAMEVSKLSKSLTGSLIRCDAASGENEFVSLILLLSGSLEPHLRQMLVGCVRALAGTAGIDTLIRRLSDQQNAFARNTYFTGHHLKTPIQAALNSLHEVRLELADRPAQKQALDKMEEQLMLGMADSVRLQEAADAPQMERFNLQKMVVQIVDDLKPLSRPRGITVKVGPNPSSIVLEVLGEMAQLRAAITALLDNAIKYAFEASWVDIRFRVLSDGEKFHDSRIVAVEIEDVGVGFPPERKEELFSLGARLDSSTGIHARPGSGIGLVQAKEYLENAGGSLDVDSALVPFSQSKYKVTATVHLPLT